MTGASEPKTALLEIACFDAESAIIAWKAGADRIELCDGREQGGTTPSLACITQVKQHVTIPVYAMIRPRGGDFVYTDEEFEQMLAGIEAFTPLADGLVFGILDSRGEVDILRTSELVRRAKPLPCTFHRAIDEATDLYCALEDVVSAGCHAVLSSGGKPNASEGAAELAGLVRQAGERMQILPGGGVRTTNIHELRQATGATIFHSSGIPGEASKVDPDEIRGMKALLRRGDGEGA